MITAFSTLVTPLLLQWHQQLHNASPGIQTFGALRWLCGIIQIGKMFSNPCSFDSVVPTVTVETTLWDDGVFPTPTPSDCVEPSHNHCQLSHPVALTKEEGRFFLSFGPCGFGSSHPDFIFDVLSSSLPYTHRLLSLCPASHVEGKPVFVSDSASDRILLPVPGAFSHHCSAGYCLLLAHFHLPLWGLWLSLPVFKTEFLNL